MQDREYRLNLQDIAINNIIKLRKSQKIRQKKLADIIGMSRTSYNQLENSNTKMTLEKLEQIAQALDVPWQMLLEHKTINTYTINSFED